MQMYFFEYKYIFHLLQIYFFFKYKNNHNNIMQIQPKANFVPDALRTYCLG